MLKAWEINEWNRVWVEWVCFTFKRENQTCDKFYSMNRDVWFV